MCASFEDLPSMHDDDLLGSYDCAEPEARDMSVQRPNRSGAEIDRFVVSLLLVPLVSPFHDYLLRCNNCAEPEAQEILSSISSPEH